MYPGIPWELVADPSGGDPRSIILKSLVYRVHGILCLGLRRMRNDDTCLYTLSCKLQTARLLNKMFHEHKNNCDLLHGGGILPPLSPIPYDLFHSLRVYTFELCFIRVMVTVLSLKSAELLFNCIFSLPALCATYYATPPINHRPVHWRTGLVSTNNERVVLVRLH